MSENTPTPDPSSESGLTPRNIMSRSARTMRVKFPSVKNRVTIYVESLLERDAALRLELDPNVVAYWSQPRVDVFYMPDGQPYRYTPDFMAEMRTGKVKIIEVKPKAKLSNPRLAARLGQIALRYRERDIEFVIWTEDDLRKEPQAENRRLVWSHIRRPPIIPEPEACLEQLKEARPRTWREACRYLGNKIAHWFMARGCLRTDPSQALTPDSPITGIGKEEAQ